MFDILVVKNEVLINSLSILEYLESKKCKDYLMDYDTFLASETVKEFYGFIMNNVFPAMEDDVIKQIKLEGIMRQVNNLQ